MKFRNFLKAFVLIVLSCAFLVFWYASENYQISIPVDNTGENSVIEETVESVPFNNNYAEDIKNISNNTLNAADERLRIYLNDSTVVNPKAAYLTYNLISGEYLAYNADTKITGASVIKSAYCLYVIDGVALGNFNLDEVLTYQKDDKRNGTGVIKESAFGTKFTVRELITLSITESDNIAHKMLVDRFGRNNFNSYLDRLGIKTMHLFANGNTDYYTTTSPRDLCMIFATVYKKSLDDDLFGWYLDILSHAKYNYISFGTDFDVAHKSGFMNGAFHDAGIVLANEPYIVIIMTNGKTSQTEEDFIKELSSILCAHMETKKP